MNGKRQTIWLVSMLSLMVVLSAYYLFTEDSGSSVPKETAGIVEVDGSSSNTADSDPALPSVGDQGVVVNEVVTQGEVADDAGSAGDVGSTTTADKGSEEAGVTATDAASSDTAATNTEAGSTDAAGSKVAATTNDTKSSEHPDSASTDTKADAKDKTAASTEKTAKNDAAILDEVASQSVSASSLFTNYLYEREQKNLKNHNDLLAQINDMNKKPAETAAAQEQLLSLEEKESKINGIEEQLQQKYGEAIVKEEGGDAYKVVVLSDKLDVKQAVGIVDLVMKELSVTQDKVSVQYVSEQ